MRRTVSSFILLVPDLTPLLKEGRVSKFNTAVHFPCLHSLHFFLIRLRLAFVFRSLFTPSVHHPKLLLIVTFNNAASVAWVVLNAVHIYIQRRTRHKP